MVTKSKTYSSKKKSRDFWSSILNGGRILSDEEGKDMENIIKKLRKEKGFRSIPKI